MSWLANKSNDELLGYLNNEDGTGLSEAAKQELARRGALPEWSNEPANVAANLEASATPIAMEPEVGAPTDGARMAAERGRIRRAGLHPQTPVDPGTPEQQANWDQFLEDNPDEMQRYRPEEYAAGQAVADAEAKKALLANMRMKYGPEEEAKAVAAMARGETYVPHFAHQTSANELRRDLETTAAKGNQASREFLNMADERYTDAVSRPRWAREAGLSQDAEDTASMSDGDLRLAAANKQAGEKQARDLQWRAMVMMRAGNYAGALALPGMDDAMRSSLLAQQTAALNANRPGGPINFGPTPLGVEAATAARQDPQNDVRLKGIEAQIAAANADREARSNEFKAMMDDRAGEREQRQLDRTDDRAQRLKEMEAASARDLARIQSENERFAAQMRTLGDNTRLEWDTRERMNRETAEVEKQKADAAARKIDEQLRIAEEARTQAQREQQLTAWEAQYGPGVRHLLEGDSGTPEAATALQNIAREADQSWMGFWKADAERMNAILKRLGIEDPTLRRTFVEQHGLAAGSGRGSHPSRWFHGTPTY
jgi:hypothetical protein